ncbi:LacI family DNA-binding transcriptional regulator [Chitinophaga sp. XS-30]|uniref:LacI family DNA-binding transcriptional regulator n=1 Tax=Chitinophaga sp. XS-30 TaxID=2604421 RepID=UPI0011DD710E|nr:LacI family DNA-binding transcriptional regulator [Chitinophaga sp. XS-30]QEH41425.1 LacI family transcriptional regulator [Chitinophaga sp. XS-30]
MKGVSIKDIAKQAGVSPTTVSFVLNGKAKEKRISDQVSKKILKLASKLKYKPNQLARGLRTGKTKTIGLIVEDIANHFFANVAKIVEEEADKFGYKVLYGSTEDDQVKAKGLLEVLEYRQVDGYIITPTPSLDKEIEALKNARKPMVLMDRYLPQIPTNYVMVNNFQGAYDAAEYLLDTGYSKIALVTTTSEQIQMKERLNGFTAAMKAHNASFPRRMLKKIPFTATSKEAVEQIKSFIKGIPDLDAIFFSTNYLGIYGIESIKELGLKIGEDVALISFDDHDLFRLHTPGITCVAQPINDIARNLIQVLMHELNGNTSQINQVILPATLIKRESCRKIGQQVPA